MDAGEQALLEAQLESLLEIDRALARRALQRCAYDYKAAVDVACELAAGAAPAAAATAPCAVAPAPQPRPPPQRPPPALVKECSLRELLEQQHVVLIRNHSGRGSRPDWLQTSFVRKGQRLLRRQELPREAVVSVEVAALATETFFDTGVISHAWLTPGHPDPLNSRRSCIRQVNLDYLFWDFLSLHQVGRSKSEQKHFRTALASMHMIYGHANWWVYRLVRIPEGACNSMPYQKRGWCFFETRVSVLAAWKVLSIGGGARQEPTPVPMTPEQFAVAVQELHFTSRNTDVDHVKRLYARIFPRLTQHDRIEVHNWEVDHVLEFLEVLPHFKGLETVVMWDDYSKGYVSSTQAQVLLREALAARGGELDLGIYVKDWDDGDARRLLEALPRLDEGIQAWVANEHSLKVISDAVLEELQDALAAQGGHLDYCAPGGRYFFSGRWISAAELQELHDRKGV